jgi:hypothetical protein
MVFSGALYLSPFVETSRIIYGSWEWSEVVGHYGEKIVLIRKITLKKHELSL